MPQVRPIHTNFTAGEWSPKLFGRVDLEKYGNSAREIFNYVVRPHGGIRRRGGTQFIAEIRDSQAASRIVRFVFSTTQAYLLEFGHQYVRFFRDRGAIFDKTATITAITKAANGQITANGHGFANGDRVLLTQIGGMVELNNREVTVGGATTNTFTIGVDTSGFTAYVSGGVASRIYQITTVFTTTDIPDLQFTQNADTLFIFHPNWPTTTLVRNDHADWDIQFAIFEEGPFLDMNTTETTLSIDVSVGTGIMTASAPLFEEAHIGSTWRVWEQSNSATFGYSRWVPGGLINAAANRLYEHDGRVYRVMGLSAGSPGTLPSEIKTVAAFPTHEEGTISVFIGGDGTSPNDNGESVDVRYEHSGYCLVRIDDVVNNQNANVTILGKYRVPFTALGARSSKHWQEGAWSDKRGYPRTGGFHEQRFFAAGSTHQPATIWGSKTATYLNFQDGAEDDRALTYTIASNQVDAILYMDSGKVMVLFTTSSEYVLKASRSEEALTPSNTRITRETPYGIAQFVPPIRVGPAVLFATRAGDNEEPPLRIRELVYNFQTDSYLSPDLTILSEHITLPGLGLGSYQMHPDQIVWYTRVDGQFVGMTYERDQSVVGWHQHQLAGPGAKSQDAATLPGPEGDETYMIVQRTIGGQTKRYIELLTDGLREGEPLADSKYVDSHLSYSGAPTSNISGLNHLNGETVSALIDGVPVHGLTVTNGKVTLPKTGTNIHLGYNFTSRLKTMRTEAGAPSGNTSQGRIGKVNEITLRLHRAVGGRFGPEGGAFTDIPYRDPDAPIDEPIPLFSGDKVLPFEGRWDRERFIVIEQNEPLPLDILAIMPSLRVN